MKFRERLVDKAYNLQSWPVLLSDYGKESITWTPPTRRIQEEWIIPNESSKRAAPVQRVGISKRRRTSRNRRVAVSKAPKARRPWKDFSHYYSGTDHSEGIENQTIEVSYLVDHQNTLRWFRCIDASFFETFGRPGQPDKGLPPWSLSDPTEFRPYYNSGDQEGYREIPWPDTIDELISKSIEKMTPNIKSKLSLVNSLIELKDIVTLKTTAHRIRDVIKALSNKVRKPSARGHRLHTIRKLLEASADGFLQEQFNFAPMISDMQAIQSALFKTVPLDLSSMRDLNGKARILRWSKTFVEYDDNMNEVGLSNERVDSFPSNGLEFGDVFGFVDTFRDVRYYPSVFHSQLQFTATYSETQLRYAEVFRKLDMLGVNLDPSIVWNAIPWSFVVDWFVGVSDFLDNYKVGLLDPQIVILQYLYSVKRQRVIIPHLNWLTVADNHIDGDPNRFTLREGKTICPVTVQTTYRRATGLPDVSLFVLGGLSLHEFSLATALGITRRRKRKRRVRRPRVRIRARH